MAEEPTMRLFSLILVAWRIKNDQPEIAMRNIFALIAGEIDLEQRGLEEARALFPDNDGWKDQSAMWTEISQGLPAGPFRLTWQAEQQADDKNEGVE